ncbi:hypothetical protein C8R43DRAFT_1109362 [Mycena crocata]|nr:hypothetical protein C8R43DRAFT_1109362 [Mycena crocata]
MADTPRRVYGAGFRAGVGVIRSALSSGGGAGFDSVQDWERFHRQEARTSTDSVFYSASFTTIDTGIVSRRFGATAPSGLNNDVRRDGTARYAAITSSAGVAYDADTCAGEANTCCSFVPRRVTADIVDAMDTLADSTEESMQADGGEGGIVIGGTAGRVVAVSGRGVKGVCHDERRWCFRRGSCAPDPAAPEFNINKRALRRAFCAFCCRRQRSVKKAIRRTTMARVTPRMMPTLGPPVLGPPLVLALAGWSRRRDRMGIAASKIKVEKKKGKGGGRRK